MRTVLLTLTSLVLLAAPAWAVEKTAIDAAIDRGVAGLKKIQGRDGTWHYDNKIGATALAGLTLLECGVDGDDRAVTAAADAVRKQALTTTHTYSVSLCILFLDRLDKAADTPLIEAMLVNLLTGQSATNGGWGYDCTQAFTAAELRDLAAEAGGNARVLRGARDLTKLPAKGKRASTDLPKVVQAKLQIIEKLGGGVGQPGAVALPSDNSNTQFATLALWAGRRYGVPTQKALQKIDARFRVSQEGDGTWGYIPTARMPGMRMAPPPMGKSAAMTAAGVLGVICGHGAKADVKLAKEREKDKDAKVTIDLSKDANVKAGLQALGTAVGNPVGWKGTGQPPGAIGAARGKAYYFLWSLERVCVLLGLETLGKKDWYNWGAEVLLANQGFDGMWSAGDYAAGGVDTCFALLFLKKANLARDLSGSITGFKDPGERTLKGGGVGGGGLKGEKEKPLEADIGGKPERKETTKTPPKDKDEKPRTRTIEEQTAQALGRDLIRSKGQMREGILKKFRDSKGAAYTESLAESIPKLDAESRKLAREALADRLTRMKPATIREYFKEGDPELRRAAALAAGQKEAKDLIPDLIELLDDRSAAVPPAARASLKEMAGKDLGAKPEPWRAWWKKQARE